MVMQCIVEFTVDGPALSARAKNRGLLAEWKQRVRQAAAIALSGVTTTETGMVEVRISEFSEKQRRDRDNVAKPILDALQGVIYDGDGQVALLHAEWRDIAAPYVVRYMSPVLAAAFVSGGQFVWIRVNHHTPRKELS